jgi:DNA polymerase III sliding clamp (beta) subunit (PCNA family)
MHTELHTDTLARYLDHITPIADEFRLTYDDKGFTTQVVDAANVAFASLSLPVRNTESFQANGGGTLGIDRTRLADVVSIAATDTLELALNAETHALETDAGGLSVTTGLIEPSNLRHEPDMPDLTEQWVAQVTLPASDLQRACKAIDFVSDHIAIEADGEAGTICLTGENDLDSATQWFSSNGYGQEVTDLSIDGDGYSESLFSLGYFQSCVDSFGKNVQITLSFGTEVPCRLVGAGESGRVEYIIAPRIES